MAKAGKFGGRPKREPRPGERVHIGFRVTPDLKKRVENAAASVGRSVSQEAEMRLEDSFKRDDPLGGPVARRIVLHMVAAFRLAGETMGREKGIDDWTGDAECYLAAVESVTDALLAALPRGATDEQAALRIAALQSNLLTRIAQRKEFDNG